MTKPIEVTCNEDFYELSIKYGQSVKGFISGIYVGEQKTSRWLPWKRRPAVIEKLPDKTIIMTMRIPEEDNSFIYQYLSSNHTSFNEFKELLEKTK